MPGKPKTKYPKKVLRLSDLDHVKRAVLNTLGSTSPVRAYSHAIDDFIDWYSSEPRLAFSRPVVLRYRIELESRHPDDQRQPRSRNLVAAARLRATARR